MTGSTCPTGCPCSATPGCRSPRSSSSARWASSATSTSTSRSPRPSSGTRSTGQGAVVARDDDASADVVGHPLLASLGRDARELRRTLETGGFPSGEVSALPDAEPTTLLGWLQHDLRANHAPTVEERSARVAPRRRPQPPGPRVPRHRSPGRRAARGAGGPAPGRPDPRAARHPGDVPRHRGLRSPRLGRVRARGDDGGTRRGRAPGPPAPGPARRPCADQHQPAPGPGRRARSS